MILSGKKKLLRQSLDEILEAPDDYGLLTVRPPAPAMDTDTRYVSSFNEINLFIDRESRLPSEHSESLEERRLAKRLDALRKLEVAAGDNAKLAAHDRHAILVGQGAHPVASGSQAHAITPESVVSIDDILGGDDFGMLDLGDVSILDIKHIPLTREAADEVAQRKNCDDFWRFESIFRDLYADIRSGKAETLRFTENWQIAVGDAFILQGVMCFVDEMGEEHDRNAHLDARLRLIFENGTESNMLRRSLGKALYEDETGRRVLRDRESTLTEAFQDIRLTHRDRRTGVIYVVKTRSTNPALTCYPHLFKIGYTEQTVDERIQNAERDIAFLESPVEKVTEFQCYNMNPQRFESLVHAFLAAQRLNIELIGRDGSSYRPREWFAVSLDVAREVIARIIDGTIAQYRMDNTTGKMLRK